VFDLLKELLEKRAKAWDEAKALHDKSTQEKRGFTSDEQTQYDKIMSDVDGMTATIDRENRMQEERARQEKESFGGQKPPAGEEHRTEKPVLEREEYRAAYDNWIRYGVAGLQSEERSILDAGRVQLSGQEQRAMSSVTGTAGGYTVPQGFYQSIIDAMKFFGGIRASRATILRTSAGNDLPIPTSDDTANVGAIVGENAAVGNATDVLFAQRILKAYKYTSKTFLIPIELLQDSAFNIEAYIRQKIAERIGRILNTHFTTGTGTGQPQGIVTGAALGKTGVVGQTATVTYDDLVDLEHSVDIAYRQNAEFMFNDLTLKALRKLKDTEGRPLWQPSLTAGVPDLLNGKRYIVNNDMAAMAASAKSILFGDMANYFIRDVLDLTIFRMSEKYIENGQVGFVAFSRHDALVVDAGQGPIKYYANSAT
jgi:HK97 family phage major capsid protein